VVPWREPYELRGSSTVLREARGEIPRAYSPQYLRRESSRSGAHAGLDTGLDREASATEGECRQERDGEGLGTQVPGVSTGSQEADRNSTGECGEIQNEGSRDVGQSTQWHEYATAGRLESIRPRLVGILPAGRGTWADLRTGGLGPPAYSKVFLVEMARPEREGTEPETVGGKGQGPGRGDESSRRLGCGRPAGTTPGSEQLGSTTARFSLSIDTCCEVRSGWFNRRMRKTARPVVWEGGGAQSPSLDPIRIGRPTGFVIQQG
jgi:hypothetical protein